MRPEVKLLKNHRQIGAHTSDLRLVGRVALQPLTLPDHGFAFEPDLALLAILKQVAAAITAKRTNLTPEEAKELAYRAVKFKKERGRLPEMSAADAWEKKMAEGAAAFVRFKDEGRYV